MKRPDFPSGHDGWQAVEAIPQEASAGNAHLSVARHAPEVVSRGTMHVRPRHSPFTSPLLYGDLPTATTSWIVDHTSPRWAVRVGCRRGKRGTMQGFMLLYCPFADHVALARFIQRVRNRRAMRQRPRFRGGASCSGVSSQPAEARECREATPRGGDRRDRVPPGGQRPGGVERAEDAADIGRALDVRSIVNSNGHLIVSPGGDPIGAPTGRDPGGDPPPPKVTLTVQVLEETALGWELTAEVRVARRSTRPRVSVWATRPRTRAPTWVGSRRSILELGLHEERRVLVRVPASEYLHLAVDHFALVLVVCARVLDTGAEISRATRDPRALPTLARARSRRARAGQHTRRVCDVEGHGRMRVPVVPKRPGELALIASLDCTELPQVHGGATFQCEP
ncbi:unnamed protein product [Lampetra fluviatilis]